MSHISVLQQASIEALAIRADGCYMDATFGRGGHSQAILGSLSDTGRLIALDQDPEAIAVANTWQDPRFSIQHTSFAAIAEVAEALNIVGQLDGILFDLGVSSPQLDTPERGFSFRHDGPLDMRMNPQAGISAADWLAQVAESDLVRVLKRYGEERFAKRIARAIVTQRQQQPLTRTHQLAELIDSAVPFRDPHKHPATRSFQAIRIAVNDELNVLQQALEQAVSLLKSGGRLAVISFHSLEDRIVKRFFHSQVTGPELPVGLPIPDDQIPRQMRHIIRNGRPDADEVASNPRARSAVLRVAEKL